MGKEDAGSADVVVVEKIVDIGFEVVGVEHPSAVRDGDAELMFFVALAVERNESEARLADELMQQRAGDGFDRRSLIVVAVEGAEGPMELRHGDGGAEAGLIADSSTGGAGERRKSCLRRNAWGACRRRASARKRVRICRRCRRFRDWRSGAR